MGDLVEEAFQSHMGALGTLRQSDPVLTILSNRLRLGDGIESVEAVSSFRQFIESCDLDRSGGARLGNCSSSGAPEGTDLAE